MRRFFYAGSVAIFVVSNFAAVAAAGFALMHERELDLPMYLDLALLAVAVLILAAVTAGAVLRRRTPAALHRSSPDGR